MNLSVLIPTVVGREAQFETLFLSLQSQINEYGLSQQVEIVAASDNKEISIGKKRDCLYKMATGKFSVQIDDDDSICSDYLYLINNVIKDNEVDCIGYYELCTMDGNKFLSVISKEVKEWETYPNVPIGKLKYRRTPFFKVPILTELCKQIGVNDMRFGEDHDFAKRIHPLLKKEFFIYKEMYFYSSNSLTKKEHDKRYGITK